jgi:hypothetical protein
MSTLPRCIRNCRYVLKRICDPHRRNATAAAIDQDLMRAYRLVRRLRRVVADEEPSLLPHTDDEFRLVLHTYRAFATSTTHDSDFAFVHAMAYYVLEVKHAHLERQRRNVQQSLRHVGRARHLSTIMEHIDPDTEYIA